jgi:ribonucleoside-diphosphate reductase alpha chain
VVNKHLLHDLVERGLWETLKQELMRNNGSVQALDIPQDLELYKTVWEMSMKDIIDMSRQRVL